VRRLAALAVAGALAVPAPPATADELPPPSPKYYIDLVMDTVRSVGWNQIGNKYCAYWTNPVTATFEYLACVPAPDVPPIGDDQ
jgi:hypothetical protein